MGPPRPKGESTMRYILMSYVDQSRVATLPPEQMQALMGRYISFTQALAESGIMRGAEHLQPVETATSVRNRDGESVLTDGPFADISEVFGGFWIIDVPDLDTALKHAADCPASDVGCTEVRPLVERG